MEITTTAQLRYSMRKPQRVTITVNYRVHKDLVERSLEEGRSLSNLIAHLLEKAIENEPH